MGDGQLENLMSTDKLLVITTKGGCYLYTPVRIIHVSSTQSALLSDLEGLAALPRNKTTWFSIIDTDNNIPILTVNLTDVTGWYWQESKGNPQAELVEVLRENLKREGDREEWRNSQ